MAMRTDPGLRKKPRLALCCTALLIGLSIAAVWQIGMDNLLLRNWLVTSITALCLWIVFIFILPHWASSANSYLWSEPRGRVSLRFSVAVALLAFYIALSVIVGLLAYGQLEQLNVTANPRALWALIGASAVGPTLIGIFIGLSEIGATLRFPWLDFAKPFLVPSRSQFSDRGRLFVTFMAAITIALIQSGVVLTGGLSASFFSYLLFSAGSVAALASDRPAYAIFTVILAVSAALSTVMIGSYPPPSLAYYPTGHIVLFSLALLVGLLIDLGRKRGPHPARTNQDFASPNPQLSPIGGSRQHTNQRKPKKEDAVGKAPLSGEDLRSTIDGRGKPRRKGRSRTQADPSS